MGAFGRAHLETSPLLPQKQGGKIISRGVVRGAFLSSLYDVPLQGWELLGKLLEAMDTR